MEDFAVPGDFSTQEIFLLLRALTYEAEQTLDLPGRVRGAQSLVARRARAAPTLAMGAGANANAEAKAPTITAAPIKAFFCTKLLCPCTATGIT